MNLNAIHRLNLWWEDEQGRVLPANFLDVTDTPPVSEYPYACSRFPLSVQTEHYRRREDDGHYGTADRIAVGTSSANESLVLAMATGGKFRLRARVAFWVRFPFASTRPARLTLSDAMIVASEACGRCLNALAYDYGLDWGFPEGGPEWQASPTRCPMCEGL